MNEFILRLSGRSQAELGYHRVRRTLSVRSLTVAIVAVISLSGVLLAQNQIRRIQVSQTSELHALLRND
ncbi:MAG: hypothetical protein KDA68_19145, partial [Planctomycetaceae bacterium]|nr:hypothetical protein [Planctomycetaceae bacterium]